MRAVPRLAIVLIHKNANIPEASSARKAMALNALKWNVTPAGSNNAFR